MVEYCNERKEAECPICKADIKIAFSVIPEKQLWPEGTVWTQAGDTFTVTEGCEHLNVTGGHINGLIALHEARSYQQ